MDPTSLVSEYFASDGATNKAYNLNYHNPIVDACFEELKTTYTIPERAVLYTRILNEIADKPAVIPLFEDQNIAICTNKIGGYDAAVYGVTLDKMYWKEGHS